MEKPFRERLKSTLKSYQDEGPQVYLTWVFSPEKVNHLKTIPWSTKALLSVILNLDARNINAYASFTNAELAFMAGMPYPMFLRGKKLLEKLNYVTADGTVLFEAEPTYTFTKRKMYAKR